MRFLPYFLIEDNTLYKAESLLYPCLRELRQSITETFSDGK
jgi:hypothetical protein